MKNYIFLIYILLFLIIIILDKISQMYIEVFIEFKNGFLIFLTQSKY